MVGKEGDNSEHLKYNDVRSILRHGAANASAEIDFVGQDGRRYSARWEVRRARDRANGRLQNQKVSLKDLESGVPLGDNKVDTLTLIY
jgi:exonuclease SbcC